MTATTHPWILLQAFISDLAGRRSLQDSTRDTQYSMRDPRRPLSLWTRRANIVLASGEGRVMLDLASLAYMDLVASKDIMLRVHYG